MAATSRVGLTLAVDSSAVGTQVQPDLSEADLRKKTLVDADLSGANLSKAILVD